MKWVEGGSKELSAIGGIYLFGRRAVDKRYLGRLGALLSRRGVDGGADIVDGSVGFSYRAFHTNKESRSEVQPFKSKGGEILVWDGRLDNREDVSRLTGIRMSRGGRVVSDVELVMGLYERAGVEFLEGLVGEFALSLWDPHARRIILARDGSGVRSLYYWLGGEKFLWSSDLTALLEVSGGSLEIDEDHVAGFLSFGVDCGRTPYLGFNAVRPGHVVVVDHEGVVKGRRFWGLDPNAEIRLPNDRAYEEMFRELFTEAVACRLRADGPVVAELSGGLDSSSIVCMGHRLVEAGGVDAASLEMVSHVSDRCRSSDERKFIAYVEEHVGKRSSYLRQEDHPYLSPMPDNAHVSTINPYLTNCGYQIALKELLERHGARVLLSGIGGDELLHSVNDPAPELSDLLVRVRLLKLVGRVRVWAKLLREPYGRLLWHKAVLPALPLRLRASFKPEHRVYVPAWLNPDFVSRTGFRERNVGTKDVFGFRYPTGRDQSTGFLSVVNRISTGYYGEIAEHDVSYPFLHRPLVEFLCAIPFEQLLRPGESRSLMRRALFGILPEGTLKRRGKGDPSEVVGVWFERQWPKWRDLFESPRVVSYGFADGERLKQGLERARHGAVADGFLLTSILTLEVWLRLLEKRKRSRGVVADGRTGGVSALVA